MVSNSLLMVDVGGRRDKMAVGGSLGRHGVLGPG